MRPAILILLLSLAYGSCAPHGGHAPAPRPAIPVPQDERPRPGGEARVLVGDAISRSDWLRSTVAAPAAPGLGLVRSVEEQRAGGDGPVCRLLRLEGRYPDGTAVAARDVAERWTQELLRPESALRWLLADLVGVDSLVDGATTGVAGLRAEDDGISLCFRREPFELAERLAHPSLAFWKPGTSGPEGPGPFGGEGSLVPNPSYAGDRPWLRGVLAVAADTSPGLLFELDAVDVAVVRGRTVSALLEGSIELTRAPTWDETWFLWLDDERRWVVDPAFRAWLATSIDRQALVDYQFDGHARAVFSLSSGGGSGADEPVWVAPARRPFSAGSRPRLDLHLLRGDPTARRIAERLRQALELAGVELRPIEVDPAGLRRGLRGGEVAAALFSARPFAHDPVLRLAEALAPLTPATRTALDRLAAAPVAPIADARLRADAAWLVEHGLLLDARLVPLVRTEGWLAVRKGLRGLHGDVAGRLALERAWWAR